jgi:hypothetical protein
MVIHNSNGENVSPQKVLKEGLNHKTATKWYSNSGNLFPELTERFRPADLEAYEKPYYRFPMVSEKILVFNQDISIDLISKIVMMVAKQKGEHLDG